MFVLGASEPKAAEWTKENTNWESAYLVAHLVDWGQTLEISNNPRYTEINPALGKYPSEDEVNQYFLITGVGHYFISRYLGENRLLWQQATFIVELNVIARNASLGIRVNF